MLKKKKEAPEYTLDVLVSQENIYAFHLVYHILRSGVQLLKPFPVMFISDYLQFFINTTFDYIGRMLLYDIFLL